MTNENGQAYPKGYYFDENSTDAIPESEMKAKDMTIEVPGVDVSKAELAPAEIAQQRKEAVVNFFKGTKESFKNNVSAAGAGIKNFFGKVKAFGGKALDVAITADVYYGKGKEAVSKFVDTKAEQFDKFVEGRVDMVKLIAEFTKDKTVEKYTEVQNSVVSRYEGLKQYGSDAIEAGADKIRGVKELVRNKKNNLFIAFLKSIEEKHRAKADAVAANIRMLQAL